MRLINANELYSVYAHYPDDVYLPISKIREDIENCHIITELRISLKDDWATKKYIFDDKEDDEEEKLEEKIMGVKFYEG